LRWFFHGHSFSDPRDLFIPFFGNFEIEVAENLVFRDATCPISRLLVHVALAFHRQ
jgi:hypothetical protein